MTKTIPTQLVQFTTTDGLSLPGLLFAPRPRSKRVAINLHGNGSSSVFYSFERAASLAQHLNRAGIAFFTFNNRGAHYLKKLTRRRGGEEEEVKLGTAFELIKDCHFDIDGAIEFLRQLGYAEFYLIGHSTGANKICVYNYYQPNNPVAKYVLLGGGDDTGLIYQAIGNRIKFTQYLEKAEAMIGRGQGQKLVPRYLFDYLYSYQSFYDTANPDGDYNVFPFYEYQKKLGLATKKLFREFQSITKPTLVVYGTDDIYCAGVKTAIAALRQHAAQPKKLTCRLIAGADHGFTGYENELARQIAGWLTPS